jgi:hypothetical protein
VDEYTVKPLIWVQGLAPITVPLTVAATSQVEAEAIGREIVMKTLTHIDWKAVQRSVTVGFGE